MSGTGVKVHPQDLISLATKMAGFHWGFAEQDSANPADALPTAKVSSDNLNTNAAVLKQYQELAQAENAVLAETLTNVAAAYTKVDEEYERDISVNDPRRVRAVEAITIPAPTAQLPPIPDGPGTLQAPSAGGYGDVKAVQGQLTSGDKGSSIRTACQSWVSYGVLASINADQYSVPSSWEGDAAESARLRIVKFSEWLKSLGAAWERMNEAGNRVIDSHREAAAAHDDVYTKYVSLEAQIQSLAAQGVSSNDQAITSRQSRMRDLQAVSEQIREAYASGATFDAVKPARPPFGASAGASPGVGGSNGGGAGGGSGGGSGGGGGSPKSQAAPSGSPAGGQQDAPVSAASAKPESSPGGGSGGESGGGSPSGGSGSPSGGAGSGAGSGMPSLPDLGGGSGSGLPSLDDPSLKPASAGGGSGGGSGGGGMGSMPLQPNVGGVSVGPGAGGAPVGGGVGGGPGGGGSAGGGMGGGMGGMGHGGGHGQGGPGEKKRTPGLTPDEDLYKEDRAWTEAVIGNRPRRKDTGDAKDTK